MTTTNGELPIVSGGSAPVEFASLMRGAAARLRAFVDRGLQGHTVDGQLSPGADLDAAAALRACQDRNSEVESVVVECSRRALV